MTFRCSSEAEQAITTKRSMYSGRFTPSGRDVTITRFCAAGGREVVERAGERDER